MGPGRGLAASHKYFVALIFEILLIEDCITSPPGVCVNLIDVDSAAGFIKITSSCDHFWTIHRILDKSAAVGNSWSWHWCHTRIMLVISKHIHEKNIAHPSPVPKISRSLENKCVYGCPTWAACGVTGLRSGDTPTNRHVTLTHRLTGSTGCFSVSGQSETPLFSNVTWQIRLSFLVVNGHRFGFDF